MTHTAAKVSSRSSVFSVAKAIAIGAMTLGLLGGCAKTYITRVGPQEFSAQSGDTPVFVYMHDADIAGKWITVGEINFKSPGKYEEMQISDAFPVLMKQTRALGGNCIIIDEWSEIRQGLVQTGLVIRGRAVRMM